MPLICITGVPGTGKSAVLQELRRRGYKAVGTDEDELSYYAHNATGKPLSHNVAPEQRTPQWWSRYTWKLSRPAVEKLRAQAGKEPLFLCGFIHGTDGEPWNLFAKIFALTADIQTLRRRIDGRTNNDFGKSRHEAAMLAAWQRTAEESYQKLGAVTIDATQPIRRVVDEILAKVDACQASRSPTVLRGKLYEDDTIV